MFSCYIKVKYDNLFRKLPNIQLCCYLPSSVQFWSSSDGSSFIHVYILWPTKTWCQCWTMWKRSFLLRWSLKAKPNIYILGIWHTKLLRLLGKASLKLPHGKACWELIIIMLTIRRWSKEAYHLKRMSEESYVYSNGQSMLQIGFASLVVLWVELSQNAYDPPSRLICPGWQR